MTAPIVSVIIPVFNGERFLDEAIVSTLAQQPPPDEVIVVDDGSTDTSAEIARRHQGVHVIELGENRGPSAARNAGAAQAVGDVLVFHDADDLMIPGRIATQVAHLREHPEVDVVLGRQHQFLTGGTELPDWAKPTEAEPDGLRVTIGQPTIRSAAFTLVGGYDESFRVGEDLDLLYRCRDLGAIIAVLDEAAVERRIHDANTTIGAVQTGVGWREQVRSIHSVARRRRAREVPVTAVIAVRDGARFVADAVKSVLTQTRVPAQIIVIDDGSVDATPEILAGFGERITVEHIASSGTARARNHALSLATGQFVAFCDHDDMWLPEKIEVQLRALAGEPEEGALDDAADLAGVFCGIEEFHDDALLGDRVQRVRVPMILDAARMTQNITHHKYTYIYPHIIHFPTIKQKRIAHIFQRKYKNTK